MDPGSTGSARVQKGRDSAGQGAHQHLPTVQQDPDPVSQHHMSTWIHWKPSSLLCVSLFSFCVSLFSHFLIFFSPTCTFSSFDSNRKKIELCVHSCVCAYLLPVCTFVSTVVWCACACACACAWGLHT